MRRRTHLKLITGNYGGSRFIDMEGRRERMRRVVVCVIGRENDYYGSENARLNTTEFIHSEFIYN